MMMVMMMMMMMIIISLNFLSISFHLSRDPRMLYTQTNTGTENKDRKHYNKNNRFKI